MLFPGEETSPYWGLESSASPRTRSLVHTPERGSEGESMLLPAPALALLFYPLPPFPLCSLARASPPTTTTRATPLDFKSVVLASFSFPRRAHEIMASFLLLPLLSFICHVQTPAPLVEHWRVIMSSSPAGDSVFTVRLGIVFCARIEYVYTGEDAYVNLPARCVIGAGAGAGCC